MKKNCLFTSLASFVAVSATAQVQVPLTVTQDMFNNDEVFVVKDRVEWDASNNGVKEMETRDACNTVFKFEGTPGFLHLDHSRTRWGSGQSMQIQESADGENFTDLYNGASSTDWNALAAPLKKDTRYIRMHYEAKYKFGDLWSRMGYWRNISVSEPIASQEKVDTINVDFGSKTSYQVSVACSNPTGDVVLSSTDPHIVFDEEGATQKTFSGLTGQESTLTFTVYYDASKEPAAVGERTTGFTISDSGSEGYAKDYKLVANVNSPMTLQTEEGSVTGFVGSSTMTSFMINTTADIKAEDISVVPSSSDVALDAVREEGEGQLAVALNYSPKSEADNYTVNVAVTYNKTGLTLVYKLMVTAYKTSYTIASAEDFNKFAAVANKGVAVSAELSADIAFTEATPNVRIDTFTGVLDGKYHTVSGWSTDDSAALFGSQTNGTVKNMALEGLRLLPSTVEGADALDNGLSVEYCYGTPSDNGNALLMNYNYMATDKVKYTFTRVRSEEDIDAATGLGTPVYMLKLGAADFEILIADQTTAQGTPSCFSMWQKLDADSVSANVFGMLLGQDEMPSFANAENTIVNAKHYNNVEGAKPSTVYVQNGKYYDGELNNVKVGDANDFLVLSVSSETLSEGVQQLPNNVVTSDGKAAKVVLTDGADYVFPSAAGFTTISADSVVYSRNFSRTGVYAPVCLPFATTSYSLDAESALEGDTVDIAFVDTQKETVSESTEQIILQSAVNPAYAMDDRANGKFAAGTVFFFSVANTSDGEGNAAVTFVGENATLDAAQPSLADNAPFNGTFKAVSSSDVALDGFDVYTLHDATVEQSASQWFAKASADAQIGSFRAYAVLDSTITGNGTQKYSLKIAKGDVDGIDGLSNDEASMEKDAPVYTLGGQRVSTLRPNQVYIKNGKKFFTAK